MVYSIIIPAFNEAKELPATLTAVRKAMMAQTVAGECIVVDNNSDDGTGETAIRNGADRVVFEGINQISRARNSGAKAASGHYLIFVDADTRISPGLLTETLDSLDSGEKVGGGAVIHFEGPVTMVGRFGIGLWKRISKLTRTAAGSFLFCRKDAFEAIGGFDESLYASEEIRLSRCLKKWGRKRGLQFEILTKYPAATSARKLQWYSGIRIIGWVLFLLVAPMAVRTRRFCGFWYSRPPDQKTRGSGRNERESAADTNYTNVE